ncbi:Subtilisin-like protease SDD1 [Acorus gramineus]|uniref:Subtilisin-like protease SDD1 n=1 Tax=Acorus gramineus TaxID=55184 RepID=A0AAV9BA13_ACOGR|nr:Subtilisin-like protease SDD1 [Acorus gramineus]
MEYYVDPIAIIAFVATQKGIFVSCAVGNSGPSKSSLSNGAPWVLTVGASTIDRSIRATAVRLGEGTELDGDVLKPDIIRPGVNVLAAWPFDIEDASQGPTFNIISGTSMSAPHFSGVAALFKSAHPDWSPAMIQSALLTTADRVDHQGKNIADQNLNRANLFATGAGHVNPSKAIDPGLVYDLSPENNISYLCAKNYSDDNVSVIAHKTTRCADYQKDGGSDLNYPSITGHLNLSVRLVQKYKRTVTNVGEASSNYKVEVDEPRGVSVVVEPQILQFSRVNEKDYFVTLSINSSTKVGPMRRGSCVGCPTSTL